MQCNIAEKDRTGGELLMVLGGFSPNCCIELYIVAIGAFTVLRYRLDILVPTVRRVASF